MGRVVDARLCGIWQIEAEVVEKSQTALKDTAPQMKVQLDLMKTFNFLMQKFVTLSDWFIIKSNGPSCVDYTSPSCLAV